MMSKAKSHQSNTEPTGNQPTDSHPTDSPHSRLHRVRIDKWLWAARFYRTRSLAKQAIEGGKVHMAGNRVKTSKEISVGDEISIRQGSAAAHDAKTVTVLQLSDQRGSASIAQSLYTETQESIARRAYYQQQRQLSNLARPDSKPNKKQRRDLQRFKQQQ